MSDSAVQAATESLIRKLRATPANRLFELALDCDACAVSAREENRPGEARAWRSMAVRIRHIAAEL